MIRIGTCYINWYMPSEWLYVATGLLPEKRYDRLDKLRWWLERRGM